MCVLFGKNEGSLQKYLILMLNMSINTYKSLLELCIDWSESIRCTNMHLNTIQQFRAFFLSNNINNLQSWTKLLIQNRKSVFQWKYHCPPNHCCLESFRVLKIKFGQIQHWYVGVRERICNLKKGSISSIYWI